MKLILEYSQFENDQTVYLDDNKGGPGFFTNKFGANSISSLNKDIIEYITNVYKDYGFEYQSGNKDININGVIINTEYIDKMVNNYTIFKTFIRENNIRNDVDFYKLIRANFHNIYNYNGDFFKRQSLPILINTTRKGNIGEIKSKSKFIEYAKSVGLDITIIDPTMEEDIRGIDAKFKYNKREIKIQIKPFTYYENKKSIRYSESEIHVKSNGSLSVESIDYLMLYSDNNYIIIKNIPSSRIQIKGDIFVAPLSNVLYCD